MIQIQVEGLREIQDMLGADIDPALKAATFAIGQEIRNVLAVYPGPVQYPLRWTRAERIAYLSMRREAGLPAKYTRNSDPMSQRLGPSWTVEHSGQHDAIVGTRVTYAPFVQSSEQQKPMHKATGWITDEQAAGQVQESGVINQLVNDAVMHALGQ
jgi:hypothetical protein